MLQINLFKAVLDPVSLDIFWMELTSGAYGVVDRAEGFFNIVNGQGYGFQFIAAEQKNEYAPIEDAPCLVGRPDRVSMLQISGQDLDLEAIEATILACSLSDDLLEYHQSQMMVNP
jgi:hypothetical protein